MRSDQRDCTDGLHTGVDDELLYPVCRRWSVYTVLLYDSFLGITLWNLVSRYVCYSKVNEYNMMITPNLLSPTRDATVERPEVCFTQGRSALSNHVLSRDWSLHLSNGFDSLRASNFRTIKQLFVLISRLETWRYLKCSLVCITVGKNSRHGICWLTSKATVTRNKTCSMKRI